MDFFKKVMVCSTAISMMIPMFSLNAIKASAEKVNRISMEEN